MIRSERLPTQHMQLELRVDRGRTHSSCSLDTSARIIFLQSYYYRIEVVLPYC